MSEKFLLMIEFECSRQGVVVPWDDIAHRFHPGATAAGVLQHFARLRSVLAAEGHLIPPKLPTKKDRGPVDSTIRGFVRVGIDNAGAILVRPLKYTQPFVHINSNRADAHDIGAYDEDDANDDGSQPRKVRKLESADGGQPGSAAKVTKPQRRTRVPIKYLSAAEFASKDIQEAEADYEDDEDDTFLDDDDDDDVEDEIPLGHPVRGGAHIEQIAESIYSRNTKV